MGKYERRAYERQERDLKLAYGDAWNDPSVYGDPSQSSHPSGLWFDLDAGDRVVTFIERFCKHYKGEWAGNPMILEDWQRFVLRVAFGWKKPDGSRRFSILYEEVPRKNGKTTQTGGVGNYLMIADGEPGAEIYSTATKEDQAKLVWTDAKEMVKMSSDLRKHVQVRQKQLSCERMKSFFKPLGADSDTLDGLNPHGHLCDEMHAHKKRDLFDVMITGMGARRQPMTIIITTAGVYDPSGIGWEMHTHAQQVLDGTLEDDSFFGIIFAADENDDWRDPATWAKANPNLGVSVKEPYLQDQSRRAEQQPSFLNSFLRLHLNVWTQQVTRWIPLDKWNACDGATTPWEALKGRPAFLGLDLSTRRDITALAVVIPFGDTYDCFWRFFVPEEVVRERAREKKKPDYEAWVKAGFMIATPGNVVDYGFIQRELLSIRSHLSIRQLAYDPWNATQFTTQLQAHGFSAEPDARKEQLVEIRQGFKSLSEPSKEFEALVVEGKIRHGGHPVMRWMVDNAVIRRDANDNIAPDKRSATGRIDGVVSTIMALSRAIVEPVQAASIYATRGVRSLQ